MSDDTYTVARSLSIDAPSEHIFSKVIDFREWGDWSPWEDLDPDMKKVYSGAESGVGSRYAWSGNRKVGEGNMEITDASEPSSITVALEFLKPFKASNTTVFSMRPEGAGTHVTWAMTGRKTLMTRVMGVFKSMDAMIGPDFEKGLSRLKAAAEGASE